MMLSLKKLDQMDYEKKQKKKIERELPYFITIVTLLATSGLGPYFIFKKLKEINLLPTIKIESEKILKRIDLLGLDPLTAMNQAKDKPSSKALGEFLTGYVSSIQSGGNVLNYLKSKMTTAYENHENAQKQSIEKVSGVVHGWLSMQIVVLALFIMISAMSSGAISGSTTPTTDSNYQNYLLLVAPILSIIFLKVVQNMNTAYTNELEIKKILRYAIPSVLIATVLVFTNVLSNMNGDAYVVGGALIAASLWPALKFKKIYTLNIDAEDATPQILRDITEARKAGIGPEKCVIRACKRTDYKSFNPVANAVANKLEWGIPLKDIFETIQKEIKNFQVLISFRILFEVISSGGGNVNTLDSLSNTSEKMHTVELNKREMLKPYIMVGFMVMAVTAFTTLLVISSFEQIDEQKNLGETPTQQNKEKTNSLMQAVSISILVQSWLAGLFIGKITTGVYSGGFLYAIFLIIISFVGIAIIQAGVINISSIMGSP
ncbi:MAG: type II secretion system F family protein [Nitrosopumilaceae archaeon]